MPHLLSFYCLVRTPSGQP